MQTSEEHIKNSEQALQNAKGYSPAAAECTYYVNVAQVEATLALAAAQVEENEMWDQ